MVIIADILVLCKDVSTNSSRISRRTSTVFKKMCFDCNEKRLSDNNKYKEGDSGRCEMIVPRSF